jgi:hypothetical protein
MPEERKPLYDAVIDELNGMDSVEIRARDNFATRLRDIHRLGEVVVGYETEKKPYLWGLIKLDRPLASLDDIREVLAQNPDIGQPVATGDNYLMYERFLGGADINMHFNGTEYTYMVDKVAVRERPLIIRD